MKILLSIVLALAGALSLAGAGETSPTAVKTYEPTKDGFLQHWLILEPIRINDLRTSESGIQAIINRQYFPDQLSVLPRDGDHVTADGTDLVWHAVHPAHIVAYDDYAIDLHRFAYSLGKPTSNVLFWGVTWVNCPQEYKEVRLAVGTNMAGVFWLNGKQVVGNYGDLRTIIDDAVSKRLTLIRGVNVLRFAILNNGGYTDFCARFLDKEDEPVKGFTMILTPPAGGGCGSDDVKEISRNCAGRRMNARWTAFARTGVPGMDDIYWPPYGPSDRLLEFGEEPIIRQSYRQAEFDYQERRIREQAEQSQA